MLAAAIGQCAHAEDGSAAWLRYAPVKNAAQYRTLPSRIAVTGDTPAEQTAAKELQRGLSSMLGRDFTVPGPAESRANPRDAIVIGSESSTAPAAANAWDVRADAYRITTRTTRGATELRILGSTPRAELYGVFHLLELVYDAHYAAALAAGRHVPAWMSLKGKVDDERYQQVLKLFHYQAGHPIVWRDSINDWFEKISGIPDAQGPAWHHAGRIEAEAMQSKGFMPVDATRWETVSGAKAMECRDAGGCTLTTAVAQPKGFYDVAVQYFDLWRGATSYDLQVNGVSVGTWKADDTLPPVTYDPKPDGENSTRYTAHHIALQPGDILTLHASPDMRAELTNIEPAAQANGRTLTRDYREPSLVDYIVIGPDGPVTPQ